MGASLPALRGAIWIGRRRGVIYVEAEEQVVYLIMTFITYFSEEVLLRSPRQEVFLQFLLEVFMDHHTQRTLTWTSACIKT